MLILDAWTIATWFITRLSFQNTHYFGWRKKWNLNRAHACAKPSVIIFQKLWRVYFSLWKTTLNLAYRDKCFTIMLIPFFHRVLYKNTEDVLTCCLHTVCERRNSISFPMVNRTMSGYLHRYLHLQVVKERKPLYKYWLKVTAGLKFKENDL